MNNYECEKIYNELKKIHVDPKPLTYSNQPERSKREDCKCPNRYLMNGTYMGKYCRCGALNTQETE